MPASDAPLFGSAKLFWRSLLACGALILAMCLLNASIDPTGQIGLAKTHALNRTVTPSVVSFVRNSGSVTAYESAIATTSADTFLIGTSREARGFDLCDRPNILRIAGSGWGIREIAQVHTKILETRTAPTTLLIELGVVSDSKGAGESSNASAAYTALSPRTTWLSFQTVAANIRRSDEIAVREAECRPLTSDPVDLKAAAEDFEFGCARSTPARRPANVAARLWSRWSATPTASAQRPTSDIRLCISLCPARQTYRSRSSLTPRSGTLSGIRRRCFKDCPGTEPAAFATLICRRHHRDRAPSSSFGAIAINGEI